MIGLAAADAAAGCQWKVRESAMKRLLSLFAAACITTGCASFSSRIEAPPCTKSNCDGGLVYWLPLKAVTVIYTKTEKGGTWAHTTTSVPDLRTRFVLRFEPSLIGKSDMKIGVNDVGLLSSSNAAQTGGLDDLLTAAAGAAGTIRVMDAETRRDQCSAPGAYAVTIAPRGWDGSDANTKAEKHAQSGSQDEASTEQNNQTAELCGATVTISPMWPDRQATAANGEQQSRQSGRQTHHGVFYRQNRPYVITVKQSDATVASFIVMMPNESPTEFLPLHRALFADGTAAFMFQDGVPTKYDQAAESELIALLATPAKVVEAYFGAIGSALDKRSDATGKEASDIAATNSLLAARFQQERCLQAIAAANQADVTTYCK